MEITFKINIADTISEDAINSIASKLGYQEIISTNEGGDLETMKEIPNPESKIDFLFRKENEFLNKRYSGLYRWFKENEANQLVNKQADLLKSHFTIEISYI